MKPEDPAFTVYLSQPIKNEFALAIIAHEKKQGPPVSFIAEYFVFIHSINKPTKAQRFAAKYSYKNSAKMFDETFHYNGEDLRDDTVSCAKAELDGYTLAKYEETKDVSYLNRFFDLRIIPQRRLLAYHVQGLFDEEFQFVSDNSDCGPLCRYLTAVLQVPPNTRNPIK